MKEVTRLDSAGIGMLVSKFLTARRRGGCRSSSCNPTARTDHLMEITKLTTVFEIFDDEEAALRSFGVASVAEAYDWLKFDVKPAVWPRSTAVQEC